MFYGILGSGNANSKIVQDGLADILSGDADATFLIHTRRSPQGAVPAVYDFIVDNEVEFVAYHRIDDNPPKALLSCTQRVNITDDPTKTIITVLQKSKGTLLILWDEENPEHSEKIAVMGADAGLQMKDLSDGLAPIVVEGSAEPESSEEEKIVTATPPKPVAEEIVLPFSRDELLSMNYAVLRRQAKAQGLEDIGKSKEEVVEAILKGYNETDDEPIIATDTHEPSNIGNGFFTWLENGEVHTHPLQPIMVKWLIEELKTA